MTEMTARLAIAMTGLLLLAGRAPAALAAAAQNLVTNARFDSSLSGWQVGSVPGGTAAWDGTLDADGSAASGSAKGLFNYPTVTGLVPVLSQCVGVTAGTTYLFGGEVFIPAGQAAPSSAFYSVLFYPTPDCSGPPPPAPFAQTPAVTVTNVWTATSTTATAFGPSALVSAYLAPIQPGPFTASFDDITLQPAAGACLPGATTLCLNDFRFQVTATFDTGDGDVRAAQAVPLGDTGLLWFFSATNIEVAVKLIDGCGLNGHYWFFAGGLTNVHVVVTVTDKQSGAAKNYTNPSGTAFKPVQDTSAFTCP